jgi:hypothetical protein
LVCAPAVVDSRVSSAVVCTRIFMHAAYLRSRCTIQDRVATRP